MTDAAGGSGAVLGDDVGAHYRACRTRFIELVRSLDQSEVDIAVPSCPGWTVRDVLGHVAAIPDDALHGRLAGIPDDVQTADQVRRSRELTIEDLLVRWEQQSEQFEPILTSVGLPLAAAAIDVATHEQDVRGATGRPGHRANDTLRWSISRLVRRFHERLAEANLAPVRVVIDGDVLSEGSPDGLRLEATSFEVFRSFLGRRSADQVRGLTWSDDPGDVLGAFFVFGPAANDIVEKDF